MRLRRHEKTRVIAGKTRRTGLRDDPFLQQEAGRNQGVRRVGVSLNTSKSGDFPRKTVGKSQGRKNVPAGYVTTRAKGKQVHSHVYGEERGL